MQTVVFTPRYVSTVRNVSVCSGNCPARLRAAARTMLFRRISSWPHLAILHFFSYRHIEYTPRATTSHARAISTASAVGLSEMLHQSRRESPRTNLFRFSNILLAFPGNTAESARINGPQAVNIAECYPVESTSAQQGKPGVS